MSFSSCNYCSVEIIKREAKEIDAEVYIKGGNVFMVPKGEKLDTSTDPVTWNHGPQHQGWFMEIGDSCSC